MTSDKDSLIQSLRNAAEDIVVGERWDASLVGRVKTQLRHILLRKNLSNAVIDVQLISAGLIVHIIFPSSREGPRTVRFTISAM